MPFYRKLSKSYIQIPLQTDIEDSEFVINKRFEVKNLNKKRKIRRFKKKVQFQTFHEKIMRFPLRYSKNTLRVMCFQEQKLNFPIRFTKKLNAVEMDNDVESDSEDVQNGIKTNLDSLIQAMSSNQYNKKTQTINRL